MSLPAGAATFTVTNLNNSGAGSLRQAIFDANNAAGNDTVQFQSGLSGTILLSSSIGLGSSSGSLTINGPGASVLAISGNNATQIFSITASTGTVTINNLTLKNGRGSLGGAIFSNKTVIINHCVLSNNVATSNAGAIENRGTMTIANSILSGNSTKGVGGAISNTTGTLTIINSTLSGNSATVTTAGRGGGSGGGIYSIGQTVLTIVNSTLSGNSATNTDSGGNGGGIYFTGVRLTITNSTLSGNSASALTCPTSQCSRGLGGGLYATWTSSSNSMSVLDSTFTGNAAANVGGGIYLDSGTLTVGNSIVSGNRAPNGKEAAANNPASSTARFDSLGHNLFGENGADGLVNITRVASDRVLPGAIGTAIGSLAPNGGPTQTHLPKVGSLVVNAGSNALIPAGVTTDQRGAGFPRIWPPVAQNGTVDIGAVELRPTYALTVTKTGGNGTVTSNPTGINCGSTCAARFTDGTKVTLTATPDPGYSFTGWAGDCSGTPCAPIMDADKSVTALFAKIPAFTLTVTKAGAGSGTVTSNPAGINCGPDCSESYSTNTLVTLTAAPAAGSAFVGWSGACTGTAPSCTVRMTAAKTATATFKRVAKLTVGKTGSGAGVITGTGIHCGVDCTETYDLNATVTLTATAYAGSTFIGWSGACSGAGACTVTMTQAKTATARFNATTAGKTALTLYKAGVGLGTVASTPSGISCGTTCSTSVAYFTTNSPVKLTATAAPGSTFTGWSGACSGTGACTVNLTTGTVVIATFSRPVLTVRKVGSGLIATAAYSSGIFCGPDCTEPYNLGTQVQLVAIPAIGRSFGGWNGCAADPGFPQLCTATMDQSRTATATFK